MINSVSTLIILRGVSLEPVGSQGLYDFFLNKRQFESTFGSTTACVMWRSIHCQNKKVSFFSPWNLDIYRILRVCGFIMVYNFAEDRRRSHFSHRDRLATTSRRTDRWSALAFSNIMQRNKRNMLSIVVLSLNQIFSWDSDIVIATWMQCSGLVVRFWQYCSENAEATSFLKLLFSRTVSGL